MDFLDVFECMMAFFIGYFVLGWVLYTAFHTGFAVSLAAAILLVVAWIAFRYFRSKYVEKDLYRTHGHEFHN